MIFSSDKFNARAAVIIDKFINIRPVPQIPAWETAAENLCREGFVREACVLLDLSAKYYGKLAARLAFGRVFRIPENRRGRGLASELPRSEHPAIYALRDGAQPTRVGPFTALRSGSNLFLVNADTGDMITLHTFTPIPTYQRPESLLEPWNNDEISYIGLGTGVLYTQPHSCELSFVDLALIRRNGPQITPVPRAVMRFPGEVHRICGPASDGTFFVTCAAPLPVFSDICMLCAIDTERIRTVLRRSPDTAADMAEAGAIRQCTVLPNIEQSLHFDTVCSGSGFVTCGGGMQPAEIRFIHCDGSWETRTIHESPVIRIMRSSRGPVSLDRSGQAFIWNDRQVCGDLKFDFSRLPPQFADFMDTLDMSIDVTHGRLYMTRTDGCPDSLKTALSASHACCLTADGLDENAFIKKLFFTNASPLAMLADGELYFWDEEIDAVQTRWQLSVNMTGADDWRALLSDNSPPIDLDPRIRRVI